MTKPSLHSKVVSRDVARRRRLLVPILVAALMLPLTAAPASSDDRPYEVGVDAYVYAYPMVLMEMTRRVSTNVQAPSGVVAPMNQLAHLRQFPDHTFREVVRPNADTLYSIVWFDVSTEPLVVSVPDTDGRYYMLPMLDMWTDVLAAPGSRTSGNEAADFAIVGPNWHGKLPDGIEPIRSPTNQGWMIGRIQTNGASDYANVHRVQDAMKLAPLSRWGKPYTPPAGSVNSDWDMRTPPPVQVAAMSAEAFFGLFAELLKLNPPHEMDWNMIARLRQIGIVPGEDFDFSKLPAATRTALERAVPDAQQLIANHRTGEMIDGWSISRAGMGNYGTSYTQRAYIALIGLGANVAEDAIYPMIVAGANGIPLQGRNEYVMHFEADDLPPVNGFWSLAMYDGDGYFVENPIDRNSIGDRDELIFNGDGSLDIYIQHESPGADREANWLPAPADDFNMVLRLYWPRSEILAGEWTPPPLLNTAHIEGTILPR